MIMCSFSDVIKDRLLQLCLKYYTTDHSASTLHLLIYLFFYISISKLRSSWNAQRWIVFCKNISWKQGILWCFFGFSFFIRSINQIYENNIQIYLVKSLVKVYIQFPQRLVLISTWCNINRMIGSSRLLVAWYLFVTLNAADGWNN